MQDAYEILEKIAAVVLCDIFSHENIRRLYIALVSYFILF